MYLQPLIIHTLLILIQHYRVHSTFLPFHICNSLLGQWETRLPLSLIYLPIWSILLKVSKLPVTAVPSLTGKPFLPNSGSNTLHQHTPAPTPVMSSSSSLCSDTPLWASDTPTPPSMDANLTLLDLTALGWNCSRKGSLKLSGLSRIFQVFALDAGLCCTLGTPSVLRKPGH